MTEQQSTDQRAADRATKRRRVLDLLDRADARSVLLTSDSAVTWYLDGGRSHVSLAAPPIVAVRVTRDGDEVFATSNEVARLLAEELPRDVRVVERAWYEPLGAPQTAQAGGAAARGADLLESDLDAGLRAARAVLLPGELDRFRRLGADSARALTDVLLAVEPTWSERRTAAEVGAAALAAGADPLVLLVAGESRAAYPHPLPTDAPLGRRALVVMCARRDGLIANLSRWVAFGGQTAQERDAERRILEVEAAAFSALVPGTPLSEVLRVIAAAYDAQGFGADRWLHHHQGGAAGYAGRDPRALPGTADVVQAGQAFSWNPWVPGAKVEDTVLLTDDKGPRISPLTIDERWPTANVNGIARPVTLER